MEHHGAQSWRIDCVSCEDHAGEMHGISLTLENVQLRTNSQALHWYMAISRMAVGSPVVANCVCMSDSPALAPTEVAASAGGGRRDEAGNPGNVTPSLFNPLASANASWVSPARALFLTISNGGDRRQPLAMQKQEIATSINVQNAVQLVQQRHGKILAKVENQIARIEFQAYAGDQKLLQAGLDFRS